MTAKTICIINQSKTISIENFRQNNALEIVLGKTGFIYTSY
jgi:hypothetical protein